MRRAAIAHGVPPTAMLVDPVSRDTFENARETARLLSARGLRSVLLVSDRVHLPRAALLFRLAGLRIAGRGAGAFAQAPGRRDPSRDRRAAVEPFARCVTSTGRR
jgi:uncharacterized SAM-binding protein YcdF (DUF218 family)